MAEYSLMLSGPSRNVENERLDENEIREMEFEEHSNRTKKQKLSVRERQCDRKECMLGMVRKFAMYLCYLCNIYLCEECLGKHDQTHEFVRVESVELERKRMASMLVSSLRSEETREANLNVLDTKVFERLNVKHDKLDKEDCDINGLCGLNKNMWIVLDINNSCMKVFSSLTNVLLRYVRFGSIPYVVAEIKQKSTDLYSASASHNVSGVTQVQPTKQAFIAVTFHKLKQIWFIDLNITPAVKSKAITAKKPCYSIECSDDQIFTLCQEFYVFYGYCYSVDILSLEGYPIKVIDVDIKPLYVCYSDLTVYKEKLYLTDDFNNKVLCISVENGKPISNLHEGGSRPTGISVDPIGDVFVCELGHSKVYKLTPDLQGFESLSLDAEYTREPFRICYSNDKLFVSHFRNSSLHNCVTVFQIE